MSDIIVQATQVIGPKNDERSVWTPFPKRRLLELTDAVSHQFNLSFGTTSLASIYMEIREHVDNAPKSTREEPHEQISLTEAACRALTNRSFKPDIVSSRQQMRSLPQKIQPCFMKNSSSLRNLTYNDAYHPTEYDPREERSLGGALIFDLCESQITVEMTDFRGKGYEDAVVKHPGMRSMKDVLVECAVIAQTLEVEVIQILDLSMLLANAAYDDNKAAEIFQEKVDESCQYKSSLLIVDLDSLVGSSVSVTDSSMGQSVSSSITNTRMFQLVVNLTNMRTISPIRTVIVAIVSSNQFLLKKIRAVAAFKLTHAEKKERIEYEKLNSTDVVMCQRCRGNFTPAENRKTLGCTYHDGDLYYSGHPPSHWQLVPEDQVLSTIIQNYNMMERSSRESDKKALNMNEERSKFVYICCDQSFGHQGCKKNYHTTDRERCTNYAEKFRNLKDSVSSGMSMRR